jgi:hypothetical protein
MTECNKLNVLVNIHATCWQNSILTMLWLSRTTYKKICPYVVDKMTGTSTICESKDNQKLFLDKKTYLPEKYDNGLCDRFINTIINYWKQLYEEKELLYFSLATLIDYKDLIYNYNIPFNTSPRVITLLPNKDDKENFKLNTGGTSYDIFFFLLFITIKLYNLVCDFAIVKDITNKDTNQDIIGWLFLLEDSKGRADHMTSLFYTCDNKLQYHDSNKKAEDIIIINTNTNINIQTQIINLLEYDTYKWRIKTIYKITISESNVTKYKEDYIKYYNLFTDYYSDKNTQVKKLDSKITQKILSFNNHEIDNIKYIRELIINYDFIAIQNISIDSEIFKKFYYGDGHNQRADLTQALTYNYLYNGNLLCLFEKNPNIIAKKFDSIDYIENNKQQIIYININSINKKILDTIIKIVNIYIKKIYKIVICLGNNTELKINDFKLLINLKTTKKINVYISQQKTFGKSKFIHTMSKWYDSIIVINSNIDKANIITSTTLHRPLEIKITNPMIDAITLWKQNTKITDDNEKFIIDNELAILKNELHCVKYEDNNKTIKENNKNEEYKKRIEDDKKRFEDNIKTIKQIINKYKNNFNIIIRVFDIMSVFSLSCDKWEEEYKKLWKEYSKTEDITEESIKIFYITHQFAKNPTVKSFIEKILSDKSLLYKLKILQHQLVLSNYVKPIFEKMSIDDKYTMINKYDIEEIKQNAELLNICFLINEPFEDITASIIVTLHDIDILKYYTKVNHNDIYVIYNHLVIKNVKIQTPLNDKRIFIISCYFYTDDIMNIIYIHLDEDYDKYNKDIIGKKLTRDFTFDKLNLYTKENLYDYIRELINYPTEDNDMYIEKVNEIKTRLNLTINISKKFILYSNKLDYIYIPNNIDNDGSIRLTVIDEYKNASKAFNFTNYNKILNLYNIEYTNSSTNSSPIPISTLKAKSKAKQKYHKYKLKYIKLKAKLFNL